MQKKYHLIAIGGSVMHNVAIDLQDMGHIITGSDDEIYEPSRSRLQASGLLPAREGWDSDNVHAGLDAVILGKHARDDNPELRRALELGIPVYSFPEFIASHSKATQRVCIAGSHGKTSTTAIIMHVLRYCGYDFDYLVGAQLKGFDKMVRISGADILICEGDEYSSSALDDRAKMLHYKANIAVVTGLAWDHVNIYKTYEQYKDVFRTFVAAMDASAICYYDITDSVLQQMMVDTSFDVARQSYDALRLNRKGEVELDGMKYPVRLFGRHNMLNLNAARLVCQSLGVEQDLFFEAVAKFEGAAKRLQLIREADPIVYRDFAHAPSKCQATVDAVRSRYPDKRITAILELHTYSSLDIGFVRNYKGTMNNADRAFVFYDRHALKMKRMPDMNPEEVHKCFGHEQLEVAQEPARLESFLLESMEGDCDVLLIMSSGTLGGIQLDQIIGNKTESAH